MRVCGGRGRVASHHTAQECAEGRLGLEGGQGGQAGEDGRARSGLPQEAAAVDAQRRAIAAERCPSRASLDDTRSRPEGEGARKRHMVEDGLNYSRPTRL